MGIKTGDIVYTKDKQKVWYVLNVDFSRNEIEYNYYYLNAFLREVGTLSYCNRFFLSNDDMIIQSASN